MSAAQVSVQWLTEEKHNVKAQDCLLHNPQKLRECEETLAGVRAAVAELKAEAAALKDSQAGFPGAATLLEMPGICVHEVPIGRRWRALDRLSVPCCGGFRGALCF